jgi:hypothetical protein
VRGVGRSATGAAASVAASGCVPAIVTVSARVTVPVVCGFPSAGGDVSPVAESVYVVVAFGVTRIDDRGATRPMPGVIATGSVPPPPRGFSTIHDSVIASPGLIETRSALNSMIRTWSVAASV